MHVSTDYVFDGANREPWVESDPVAPLQAYGRTKLAGEYAVAEANAEHAIVRTAWLFGAGGRNFVDDDDGPRPRARRGQRRHRPARRTDLDRPSRPALVEIAERTGDVGVFHATGTGECSWYEFAVEIFDQAGIACRVVPTTSTQFARPAPRPAFSALGTERDEASAAAVAARVSPRISTAGGTGMKLSSAAGPASSARTSSACACATTATRSSSSTS